MSPTTDFGAPVHRRGIHDPAAARREGLQHLLERPRSAAESPTSKVCHVPTPITGRASPEDGMGRVLKGARPAERTSARSAPSAAAPARTIASRRDSGRTDRDGMERG